MSTLLSCIQSVPPSYVMPEDKRPGGDIAALVCKDIPVIDLSLNRVDLIQQIMKANMDLGMFQVINHGISKDLMNESMNLVKEFFNMPAEDKAMYYTGNALHKALHTCKGFVLYTNTVEGVVNQWKETARHLCEPLEDHIHYWPEKPARYREVVGSYSVEVRKLSLMILDLICEGLGVELGYFKDTLSPLQELLAHNYPPCPEPDLVLGIKGHSDPGLLTILQQQEDVYGLQILNGGQWFSVEPIPHAFVVNVADQLEVISNGRLKSAFHRVVTNINVARKSLATTFSPLPESIIEPAKALVSASERQLYKSYQFKEYRASYYGDLMTLDAYKL